MPGSIPCWFRDPRLDKIAGYFLQIARFFRPAKQMMPFDLQELEGELGGICLYLLGAAGSVYPVPIPADEKVFRIKEAVKDVLKKAQERDIKRLISGKDEFKKGFELGGFQVWTGFHSLVAKGTGEAIVDAD